MSAESTLLYTYQAGGSLDFNHPTYVERQADQNLYEGLKAREFCYVLNSRQMGKSSLRVRTMQRLQQEGFACAAIDLTRIGSSVTQAQWYKGIVYRLVSSFQLSEKINWKTWWSDRNALASVQQFSEFIQEVLLAEVRQNVVIFIDEIDSLLRLDFKDDFFAVIRACYNQRVDNPEYKRLTFALLGVATPSDLIQDKNRTPFNIGRAIELNGFQLEEAQLLAQGLVTKVGNPQAVLKEVWNWTGGQPFLIQKLCKLILSSDSSIPEGSEVKWVEELVRSQVIENWEFQDEPEHLRTIRDRILRREQLTSRLLGLYQQILQRGEIAGNDSLTQMELRLSGLVVKQQGKLRVYNRIYKAVFDQRWVEKALAELRPYAEAISAWLAANCQDESRLLRGQALQEALAWTMGKSVSEQDYQFLAASQEFDKKELQKALEAEKQASHILADANQTLADANQTLTEAQQKAKRIIRTALVVSSVISSVVIAAIVVLPRVQFVSWPNPEEPERCTLKQIKCTFDDYNKPSNLKGIGGFYVNLISRDSAATVRWVAKKCNNAGEITGEKRIWTFTSGKNYINFPYAIFPWEQPVCSFTFTLADLSPNKNEPDKIEFLTNFDVDLPLSQIKLR